jgi:hypothetical protein
VQSQLLTIVDCRNKPVIGDEMTIGESELAFVVLSNQRANDRTPVEREYKLSGFS